MNGGASYLGTSQPTPAHGMMREGAAKPERLRWQPKPERRAAKLAAKIASAARRQVAGNDHRRIELLCLETICGMKHRTKKQQRRKRKALNRYEARVEAKGATFLSRFAIR